MSAEIADSTPQKPGIGALAVRLWPVTLYAVFYVVLIALYVACVLGYTRVMPAQEWLASYEKSAESAAGLRVQKQYDFAAPEGPMVSLPEGSKITPGIAREMAAAMRAGKFPDKELVLYRDGLFWNLDWAHIFTLYNLLGMFGALYLGLRKPVAQMLDAAGRHTAETLEAARAAKTEAEGLKERYAGMLAALEDEKAQFAKTLAEEEALERERIMTAARHEAQGILESVKQSINAEIQDAARKMRREVVKQALEMARQQLAQDCDGAEHRKLFKDFIGDLERLAK